MSTFRRRVVLAIASLLAPAAAIGVIAACRTTDPKSPRGSDGGEVHGSVFVAAPLVSESAGKSTTTRIYLPDLVVHLHDVTRNVDSAPVTTDLFGRYLFPHQPAGTYQLRWNAQLGWAAGQAPDPIVLTSTAKYPLPAEVFADKRNGVIVGSAHFSDGGATWFQDEFFAENRTAEISAQNAARTLTLQGPVHANAYGQFAIAGMPRGENVTLTARTEAANVTRTIAATDVSFGGAVAPVALKLANHRPELRDIVARSGGALVTSAAPGATVQVDALASDADGDSMTYHWKALAGQGTIGAGTGSSAPWTLPATEGRAFAYVEVTDGRGGYAARQFTFIVGKQDTTFSGRAIDKESSAPVAGAAVSVNGATTTTDANGFFQVRTTPVRRYVFNIQRSGFALFSRVVDAGETGQTWRLVKTQQQTVDASQPITLIDTRAVLEKKRRKGVTIRVPANSLVDPAGNKPSGPLTASLATFDIADGEAPGDWGGQRGGKETNLISYGAGFVDFVDGAGTKFNLARGATAEIEMVLPTTMAAAAPPDIPMWSYDETDGYWKESGRAVAGGGKAVGKVEHFSAFNTDLALDEAACLKVLLYPPLPTGVKLRMTDPTGANFTQTFDFILDRPLRGIYRVPANIVVHLQLFDPDGNEYENLQIEETPGVALPGNNVNSGPPIPAGQTLWPDEPYDTCKLVVLRLVAEPDPSIFLTFKGKGTDDQAAKYYLAVDPNNSRLTLGGWWTANGFTLGADGWPTNAVRTSYLNDNDLGSGRDMYFRDLGGGHLAAFVTNYGLFNQDHHNADLAEQRTTPGATVCMEFAPIEAHGGTPASAPIVKFFVFVGAGGQQNAPRVTSANLDGFGEKFVPNLCLNCHGGSYFPSDPPTFADVDMDARFRELDTATYLYPGGRVVPNATEEAAFKQQNLLVRNAGSGATAVAIRDLIAGWYPGASATQDNTYTPSGWAGSPEHDLYHDVVKGSCRTCHVAFDDDTSAGGVNWTTYDQLKARHSFLKDFVLCSGRQMPHAVVTYRNFWLSANPHRPAVLRTYADGAAWTALGDCE